MEKITTLTPEQQADIAVTFHKWRDEYSVQNDNVAAEKVIEQIYTRIGKEKPLVIFTKSPLAMVVLSAIWPDFIKRLNAQLNTTIKESTGASLDASLRASLDASLDASLRASLDASLDASLRASLDASLGASLRASLDVRHWFWWWAGFGVVDFALRHFGSKTGMNMADARLWVSIGQHLTRFTPYENVCFVAEKPIRAAFNENNVLSYDHGPAQ
ncbi:hypothetical protein UFOVP253_73, partial [uncultured Caudovirales phage]